MTSHSIPHEVFALSKADRDAVPALRETFRRFWSGPLAAAAPRVAYDAFFAGTPPLADVSLHPSTDPALPGWICVPANAIDDQALLYLHGGAYMMGTAPAYRGFVSQIAARARRTAFILEYPLAPLLIQVGADEILYDDALRYAQQAHARGHDVALQEWTDMHHVFQMNVEELEAARHALDLAARFLHMHMGSAS